MWDPRDAWGEVRAAAADREGGAAEIARRAAEALASLPDHDLARACRSLVRAHPSMAPLWRLAAVALEAADHGDAVRTFARRVAGEAAGVAEHARRLLRGEVVTLSYSSTLVAAVAAAPVRALCARSDPGGEGAATAERLRASGVRARLVPDDEAVRAAGTRSVVVGADAVGPGGVVNKVGTHALVTAAREAYAVAGSTKLIGADLPAPEPFERSPLQAFTGIVTDRGALDPGAAAAAAIRVPVPEALRDLIG